ncbi:DNA-binding MurR/RpiR family transcriptional regulator [Bacillus pakistanensis]|uniref:DNA-binding MurR/RpiR family transcriptional regulator n=1 Tax=Rossellomorea pakistanensis TaxID=992288 RepID=A0ABS2NH34_9BACI|nr:MurR/RpiR family transcriptional regulator [Bacillus pakistanensis]MBM7587177.1 DNA-binding MurR/RpiR family transcriptional regulator [Bacillus pakistanensis]
MKQKIISKIIKDRFSTLSPGQKKVAEFINDHNDEGALLTAFQLGRKVGVSETTVIRLAYALGFSGYSEMQEVVRKDWLGQKHLKDEGYPSSKEEREGEENLFTKIIDKERTVLQHLLQQNSTEDIWKAVDRFIHADRVYIGGFGSSYAAGFWFYYALKQMRENVFISSPTGFLPEDLCELSKDSVVMIFSFPRYRRESLKLANFAKKQKAQIVALTNRQLSPIGQLSDITLTTEENLNSGHHSIASVVSLLEVIIEGIHSRDCERISLRQQKLELFYTDQELFLE